MKSYSGFADTLRPCHFLEIIEKRENQDCSDAGDPVVDATEIIKAAATCYKVDDTHYFKFDYVWKCGKAVVAGGTATSGAASAAAAVGAVAAGAALIL